MTRITFEQFLLEVLDAGVEVRLIPHRSRRGHPVEFYAHPNGASGTSVDFAVHDNNLKPLRLGAGSGPRRTVRL